MQCTVSVKRSFTEECSWRANAVFAPASVVYTEISSDADLPDAMIIVMWR